MICPLCGRAKARRMCPALGREICPVCCGTKRITEIACPPDCAYLTTSRDHPPAVVVRQRRSDLDLLIRATRDLAERQARLFLRLTSFLRGYTPDGLQQLIDDDVVDAVSALAATLETAVRGVIYEHRPASLPAERLVAALKPVIEELRGSAGTAFDREAALVLRRTEDAVRASRSSDPDNRRAFVDWLRRVMREAPAAEAPSAAGSEGTRLVLP